MRIDSHQHFWAYNEAQYPWIPKHSALHRDWLPRDLAKLQEPLEFDGSIAVQARQSLEESRWLLSLADTTRRIKGVVGWVDLQNDRVEEQLAEFAPHPKFVGVRHVVQDEPDDRFLLGANFQRGIGRLADFDLTYDLLIYPRQLPAAIELAAAFPGQPFVVNHLAKPPIKDQVFAEWQAHISELAKAPHVLCKVSGLVTEADHAHWSEDDFIPYLDTIFEHFGPERLMFGSDWPVCLLAANYERVVNIVDSYTRALPQASREALFGGNAARFYLC